MRRGCRDGCTAGPDNIDPAAGHGGHGFVAARPRQGAEVNGVSLFVRGGELDALSDGDLGAGCVQRQLARAAPDFDRHDGVHPVRGGDRQFGLPLADRNDLTVTVFGHGAVRHGERQLAAEIFRRDGVSEIQSFVARME